MSLKVLLQHVYIVEYVCTHQTLIRGGHSLEFFLKQVDGFKKVPETVVTWFVQLVRVNLEHTCVEH